MYVWLRTDEDLTILVDLPSLTSFTQAKCQWDHLSRFSILIADMSSKCLVLTKHGITSLMLRFFFLFFGCLYFSVRSWGEGRHSDISASVVLAWVKWGVLSWRWRESLAARRCALVERKAAGEGEREREREKWRKTERDSSPVGQSRWNSWDAKRSTFILQLDLFLTVPSLGWFYHSLPIRISCFLSFLDSFLIHSSFLSLSFSFSISFTPPRDEKQMCQCEQWATFSIKKHI